MADKVLELVMSIQVGDVVAFEELSKQYAPLIRSQVSSFMAQGSYRLSESDRDDLGQEALLALYKAACSFENRGDIKFGLYAKVCIRNGLLTAVKKLSRQYLVEDDTEELDALCSNTEDPDASPEEYLIALERAETIQSFMEKQLTDYERRVFLLHLAHRTYAEIAEKVGKDVKSVANAIITARPFSTFRVL